MNSCERKNYNRTAHGKLLLRPLKLVSAFACLALSSSNVLVRQVLSINKADFAWSKTELVPTLEDITLSIRKGELVGVLGKVGAGKTSILSAIIGDMARGEGTMEIMGSVAYASQNPWYVGLF